MNALMRIENQLHICPCRDCDCDPESVIPVYYSKQHAIDCGWVMTIHPRYCDPDSEYVWVCPDCAKKTTWV